MHQFPLVKVELAVFYLPCQVKQERLSHRLKAQLKPGIVQKAVAVALTLKFMLGLYRNALKMFNNGVNRDEKEEVDDILPDTNIDRERTLTGKWALGLFGVIVVPFVLVAFCSPSWIEGDPRFYGTKVDKVGLWVHCFRSLPDYNDLQHRRYFAGCRWIFNPFTKGYDQIRDFLAPRKKYLGNFFND